MILCLQNDQQVTVLALAPLQVQLSDFFLLQVTGSLDRELGQISLAPRSRCGQTKEIRRKHGRLLSTVAV